MNPTDLLHPDQRRPSKAYLVNELRKAVFNWRKENYPNITDTSRRLLQFWFKEDHIVSKDLFNFWFCQREAIETIIYVYEVMKKRNFMDLARDFGEGPVLYYDPTYDQYPLYAFKMATGSGKTYVMALAMVWSYFNSKKEKLNDYTSKFLLIAPNIIVYERLKKDFEDGRLFKDFPFIPPEWQDDFHLKVILREEPIHIIPEDVLFLTNIQQLQERKSNKEEVEEYVDNVFVLRDVKRHDIYQENRIKEVLTSCPNIMILKDEAHHIYHIERAWKQILLELNKSLVSKYSKGVNTELDFTATPKMESGALFPWIIEDFSLKEAIETNIVKRPLKGQVKNATEIASKKAVERYRAWIEAGIRRWREYKNALKRLEKIPVLFIQCPLNEEADEVFSYVNSIPDLKGKVLLIHTDSTGEIKKSELPLARKAAKFIDNPEKYQLDKELKENYPKGIEAIISTMMLNEGWDVRNVNVIVGLRSYTSERKLLPEQVIGRGLRKMFPEEVANPDKSVNILDVIGPPGLIEILDELEQQEGIKFAEFDVDEPINLTTIFVDENKLDKDIEIPILTPRIIIKEFHLDEKDIEKLPRLNVTLENKILEMIYEARDMLKGMLVVKRKWDFPVPQDSKSVIAYYTDMILKQLKIGGAFATFYPLIRDYVTDKLFTEKVSLNDPRVLYKLSSPEIQEKLINLFVDKFKNLTFTEREPESTDTIRLADTVPFVWTKFVFPADKCIFNYVPCDNNFEIDFAKFLDKAEDVVAFTKIIPKIGFYVEYKDIEESLRAYYPDFVIANDTGEFRIIETKGIEDVNVARKDERIQIWCNDASKLTDIKWSYLKISQNDFEKYRFKSLKEMMTTFPK